MKNGDRSRFSFNRSPILKVKPQILSSFSLQFELHKKHQFPVHNDPSLKSFYTFPDHNFNLKMVHYYSIKCCCSCTFFPVICVLLDANGKPKNWCNWFTSVHKSYLEVGSEILTTNSYAIQPYYYRRGERLIREILEEKDHRSLEGELRNSLFCYAFLLLDVGERLLGGDLLTYKQVFLFVVVRR